MATEFKLPELGEGVDSADVSQIYVSEGDEVEADQNVMELETEKAVADLPCPHSGKVAKVHVSEGDTIEVGQTILTIENTEVKTEGETGDDQGKQEDDDQKGREQSEEAETKQHSTEDGDDTKPSKTDEKKKREEDSDQKGERIQEADEGRDGETAHEEADTEETSEQKNAAKEGDAEREPSEAEEHSVEERKADDEKQMPPPAGPATRRLARKLEVDLGNFQPPEGGRIRSEDVVRAFVESGKAATLFNKPLPDFTRFGPVEREPLNKIAQTAARRLTAAWRTIPHVTQHGLADVTELEAARRQYLERASDAAVKITLTSIALKSVAGLLKEFPKFNASLDTENDELILKKHYHIGVAVDTDHGLLVPVIRDVDRKSIEQIATELQDLADQARRRQLGKDDFEGGTFTISNQGGIGGGEFTPIVNYPEVAILGMGRARPELRLIDGQPSERLMLPLSLSYDHRVINGADAARFIDRLARILSDEFALLIAT